MTGVQEAFQRFDREFAALNSHEASQLAWRSTMRMLPAGLAEMQARDGIAHLRLLLTAHLFLNDRIDAQALRSAAGARGPYSKFRRPDARSAGSVSMAAKEMEKVLLGSGNGSAYQPARIYLYWSNGIGHLPEGHNMLGDIRQIKSRVSDRWQGGKQLPPMLPQEVAGSWLEEGWPLHPFWIDWYRRVVGGEPQNWPLLRDVALIDNALWEQGGEALDGAITDVIVSHGMQFTEYGEEIAVQPETGRLLAIPKNDLPPGYLQDVLDKIEEATRILPNIGSSNAYRALESEIELLREAPRRYAERPRMLFSVLSRAQRRIEDRIAQDDCVEDVHTNDLRASVAEARADLLAYSSEVRESVRLHQEIHPPTEPLEAAGQAIAVVDAVATVFDNYPCEEMPEDIRVALDPSASAEDRKEAGIRTAGRLLRVRAAMLRDETEKVVGNVREALILAGALGAGVETVGGILNAALKLLFWFI
ncbi:MAG: hypothetical protein QM682_05970 [Paracoccus sp. (in: a-proteobacteria)]|uniref:hypothetical protein n=1 Tax=Paracoccus sp. TaxID=267 RepID=UPI0039E24AAF